MQSIRYFDFQLRGVCETANDEIVSPDVVAAIERSLRAALEEIRAALSGDGYGCDVQFQGIGSPHAADEPTVQAALSLVTVCDANDVISAFAPGTVLFSPTRDYRDMVDIDAEGEAATRAALEQPDRRGENRSW